MYPLLWSVISCFYIIFVKTSFISKSFSRRVWFCLTSDPLSNTTCCWHVYLNSHVLLNNWLTLADDFIITRSSLIEVLRCYFNNIEPSWVGVDQYPAGQTNIIPNDNATRMLLSYTIDVWTYQVHMHQVSHFYFFIFIRWKMSTNSLSLFALSKYLARLSVQFSCVTRPFQ